MSRSSLLPEGTPYTLHVRHRFLSASNLLLAAVGSTTLRGMPQNLPSAPDDPRARPGGSGEATS